MAPLPEIKLRVMAQLPPAIRHGVGVSIEKQGGVYTFLLDYSAIEQKGAIPAGEYSTTWQLYWKADENRFTLIPYTLPTAKVTGASTTSAELSTGTKNFTVETGIGWTVGTRLRGASAANPAGKYIEGVVSAYDPATGVLTLEVDTSLGSGSVTDWSFGVAGALTIKNAFASVTEASSYSATSAPDSLTVAGYSDAGDGYSATYIKVGSEPSTPAKISMTLSDGSTAWFKKAVGFRICDHADIDAFPVVSGDTVNVIDSAAGMKRAGAYQAIPVNVLATEETARMNADTLGGVYVKSAQDTNLVYRRIYDSEYVLAEWFGAEQYRFGGSQDSKVAFQAAADFAGVGGKWRWTGLHRITATINLYSGQSVGSFGQIKEVDAKICANPEAFTGVNTATTQNLQSALFVDVGDGSYGFSSSEAFELHDCLIYGKGYLTTNGSLNLRLPNGDITKWHGNRGVNFGKYIVARNVTMFGFKYAFVSSNVGGNQGNFYSRYINTDIVQCYCAWRTGDTDSYNTTIEGCRLTTALIGEFDYAAVSFKVFGGSIEGYSNTMVLRGSTDISFDGVYFETTAASGAVASAPLFQASSTGKIRFAVKSCTIYMNHTATLFGGVSGTGNCSITSVGNEFVLGADAGDSASSHTLYDCSALTAQGMLVGDHLTKDAGNSRTVNYTSGTTTGIKVLDTLTVN